MSIARPCRMLGLCAAAVIGAGAPALAQDVEFGRARPVFALEHEELARFFEHPKDRPLGRALSMIPARLRELPLEIPALEAEHAAMLETILTTIARPGRILVTFNPDVPSGGLLGYGIVFSTLTAERGAAEQVHARVAAGVKERGLRARSSQAFPGMAEHQLPFGVLRYGPREARDGWRYEVLIGTVDDPEDGLEGLPAMPEGLDVLVRGRMDLRGLAPLERLAVAFGGPDAIPPQLREVGLIGPDALRISAVMGRTPQRSLTTVELENAAMFADGLGLPRRPLSPAELAAIPSDAIYASISTANLGFLADLLDGLEEVPDAARALESFRQRTGVDLRGDVIASLGDVIGVYMSDTTGGGSLASGVAMLRIADRERFEAAHARLLAAANAELERNPLGPGHIRLVPWEDGPHRLVSLRFPGLPAPFEITYALTGDWLILGATPQAALAAARQAAGGGDRGLPANRAFASQFRGAPGAVQVTFSDTRRLLHAGFPLVNMVGSAVANAVRSPVDPTREPGILVPMFHDLAQDAAAHVQITYWRGEALVLEIRGDPSVLVNSAGRAGLLAHILPVLGIPAAAVAGYVQEGRLGFHEALDEWMGTRLVHAAAPALGPYGAVWGAASVARDDAR